MANEDTVKKDETQTVSKRITRLEALMRKVLKNIEVHTGVDIDGDGKAGNASIALMLAVVLGFASFTFAADTVIDKIRPSAQEPNANYYATSDGTSATLTVDKIAGVGTISSYTYPVVVSGSNLVNVMMIQTGTSLWNANWTTITNTFQKSFIATPVVVWSYSAANTSATGTVAVTVSSNLFTIASPITNFSWIAVGRVK